MNRLRAQSGFAYIAAVVLLVLVATISLALLRMSNTQQATVNQSVLAARASLVARAGMEWGFYQIRANACPAVSPQTLTDFVADTGFRVTVSCTRASFNEGEQPAGTATVKNIYRIEAVACNGGGACPGDAAAVARPDYVERRRIATTCMVSPLVDC